MLKRGTMTKVTRVIGATGERRAGGGVKMRFFDIPPTYLAKNLW
jgi:hypothetical protein